MNNQMSTQPATTQQASSSQTQAAAGYQIIETVYRSGVVASRRAVAKVADFASAAEKIAHLQSFRTVQKWEDRSYTVEPLAVRPRAN